MILVINYKKMEKKEFISMAFADINSVDEFELRSLMGKIMKDLNHGRIRAAEIVKGDVVVHEWVKQAILLKFKITHAKLIKTGIGNRESEMYSFFDKIDLKFSGYSKEDFEKFEFRAVPGAFVRDGAHIGKNCVIMPSFINMGAYIGEKTMIDSGVTIGSCAQIGKHCHISSNIVIAGVLEPIQAAPVIIGDNCFVGACSVIAEGVVIEDNCVIAMGVSIGQSTRIINRETGEIFYGRVPSGSVVVSGSYDCGKGVSVACAVIVKKIDKSTREKTSINDLLRD